MRLSHPQYVKLVFRTYQLLRSSPGFSPALKQPKPAGVRNECLTVYKERSDKKDEPALRSFFGPAENNSFFDTIENSQTTKFKAFTNYLKGKASKTDDKNVELLAWLIDFPHRPYTYGMNVVLSESEKAMLNREEEIDDQDLDDKTEISGSATEHIDILTTDEQVPVGAIAKQTDEENSSDQKRIALIKPGNKDVQQKKKWLIVGVALFIAILSLGVYLFYNTGDQCMYWAGDHYERIDCDADINDKVAFNEDRFKNFKKITDLGTITEKSIGVVHYYGNKNREFYTSGGKHPVENTRYVKVMTRYIWEKEFGLKDTTAKDTTVEEIKKPAANKN